MRFTALISTLLFINTSSYSQTTMSLAKYSYPIFVLSGNVQHSGTAFFYLSNDTTFLVSNYHAIKGMSPMHNRLNFSSNTLYLKYPILDSGEEKIIEIDISENAIGKTEIFYMADRIDLLKIPINKPLDGQINYINDLIDSSYFNQTPEKVYILGYPNPTNNPTKFWSQVSEFQGEYNRDGFDEFYAGTMKKFPLFKEKEKMYGMSRFYYFIKPYIDKGYSGAPVIGQYTLKDKSIVYKFVGVNFGNEPLSMQTWIIKGDVALNYLNE